MGGPDPRPRLEHRVTPAHVLAGRDDVISLRDALLDTDPAVMTMWRVVRLASELAMLFFNAADPASLHRAAQAAAMTFQWPAADLADAMTDAAGLYEQRVIITGVNSDIVAADTRAAIHAAQRLLAEESAA